jgi:uncharacterized membrane protein YphA (DoxX/SURF4 family)
MAMIYTRAMATRTLYLFLAILRIAAGLSLLLAGLTRQSWLANPALDQKLAAFSQHPANALVAKYLAWVTPHHALFARLVVVGELGLGALLILGFFTPLAALLAFFMVLNFQLASSSMFSLSYLRGESGFVYLLVYLVLFFGRAGTALGLDGVIARRGQKPG